MRGAFRPERLRPLIDPLLKVGLAPAVAVWALSLGTPVGAHAPGCLFRLITNHECWGCGTLRAMAALLRLDLSAALALNPLSPLVAATLVALSASGLLNLYAAFGRPSHG
jgi:hypothetical protein